jgi:carbonic anhydrase
MKLAKYVVACQVALSAVLLVVFVTRSGATDRHGTRADHGAVAGDAAEGKTEAHGEKPAGKAGEAHDPREPAGKNAGKAVVRGEVGEAEEEDGFKVEAHGGKPAEEPAHGPDTGKTARDKGKASKDKEKDKAGKSESDPKQVAQALLAGNARFIEGQRSRINLVEQRESTARGQHPDVMVLGCADSRVPPELIFDRGVGDLFVVRSAGNIAEPVAVGSLEYAAEHLHTKVLLVLGHEKCGAVQAALSEAKMPTPNLEAVVGYILPAVKELKAWADGDALIHMAVEANVRRQAEEVLRKSPLLRKAVEKKELTLLKAVYDLETGLVSPL